MEALVAEREAGRAVHQPRGFRRADRPAPAQPPPARKPRRRGRVRRDQARPRRRSSPRPRPSSPMPPARTTSATSGQAGLFGGDIRPKSRRSACRATRAGRWPQRMAAERDAFGFYFSAHPVDAAAPPARRAQGARPSPSSPSCRIAEGERVGATMAGLVEGRALADLGQGPPLHDGDAVSDRSGQFEATVFDDEPSRGARSGGQGRRLRAAHGRARPPRRRRRAAGHDQALPAARRAGEADPAADDRPRGRRDAIAELVARELAGARGGNGMVRFIVPHGRRRRGDRRRRPRLRARRASSPRASSGSPAKAASTSPRRSRRSSRWSAS